MAVRMLSARRAPLSRARATWYFASARGGRRRPRPAAAPSGPGSTPGACALDDGVDGAHREVCREDEEHDADCAFGEPLDALRSMRLADLGPESPDEDDRGGRVDRRVESEAEQRQAAGRQPDDHGGATEQTGEHDAQDGKPEGSMEQAMAVHGPRIRAAPDDSGYALGGGAVESRTISVGSRTTSSPSLGPSSDSIMSSSNDAARRPISTPDWLTS